MLVFLFALKFPLAALAEGTEIKVIVNFPFCLLNTSTILNYTPQLTWEFLIIVGAEEESSPK